MKKYGILFLMCLPLLSGCGADSRAVRNGGSAYQLSNQKGKKEMPTQSPMLNEIFASIGSRIIPPGKTEDVSHIVTKYIPLGTSKEQAKQILEGMNQDYQDDGNVIHAGYGIETHPMVPSPGVQITLQFNQYDFLENIKADLSHSQ